MTLPKPSGLQPPSRGRFGLKPPGSAVSSEEAGPAQANSKPTSLSGPLLSSECRNSFYMFKQTNCMYRILLVYLLCSASFKGIRTRNSQLPGCSQKHANSDALPLAKRKKTGMSTDLLIM